MADGTTDIHAGLVEMRSLAIRKGEVIHGSSEQGFEIGLVVGNFFQSC